MTKKLILVSPIPPMKTGTANYLRLFVRDLFLAGVQNITVVYDQDGFKNSHSTTSDTELKNLISLDSSLKIELCEKRYFYESSDQFVVYFTANNEYHLYIYDLLLRPKRTKRLIVIHEPSCMMIATSYFEWDRIVSRYDYVSHLKAQFGDASKMVYEDIYRGYICESLKYEIIGFDYSRFSPDCVVVHSEFARAKLIIESGFPDSIHIAVTTHPKEDDPSMSADFMPSEGLKFGVFGFINPSKRIYEVLDAFRLFIEKIGEANLIAKNIKLLIVGQLPKGSEYSPIVYAKDQGIAKYCEFHGYVSKLKFSELISSCALVFNLRFPSCGETTGLSGFDKYGARLVMSDYHAFRELEADYFVSSNNEITDILKLMCNAYTGDIGQKIVTDVSINVIKSAGYYIAGEYFLDV